MRLIDADKIDFGKIFVGNADLAKGIRDTAQEYIDAQPTAYDVDKVVEQLEESKKIMMPVLNSKEAIEIVKSGGIDKA